MFKSGDFTSEYINAGELEEQQVQPNGVDLTVGKIFKPEGVGLIESKSKDIPDRQEIKPQDINSYKSYGDLKEDSRYYVLEKGNYIVRYGEMIEIPHDTVGVVFPRSTIMRSGGSVYTALWDSGYKGKGEGRLELTNPILIEEGSRIAQMCFVRAEAYGTYDGSYQGENL